MIDVVFKYKWICPDCKRTMKLMSCIAYKENNDVVCDNCNRRSEVTYVEKLNDEELILQVKVSDEIMKRT